MTAEQIHERLECYYAAETAILEGAQSYQIGTRAFTRADLKTIQEMIKGLEAKLATLSRGGGMRMRSGVPQ